MPSFLVNALIFSTIRIFDLKCERVRRRVSCAVLFELDALRVVRLDTRPTVTLFVERLGRSAVYLALQIFIGASEVGATTTPWTALDNWGHLVLKLHGRSAPLGNWGHPGAF